MAPTPTWRGLASYGLTRTFGTRTAVNDLSFAATPGTVTGLLGHNGCGKSTTMRMLAGVLAPTHGWFELDGVRGGAERLAVKERTGYIPDTTGVFPRLTGWEHLTLAARLHRLRDWKPRAETLLDLLDLSDATHVCASDYSHGMTRKLSAAIALLPNPYLLLADEPFDGVDVDGVTTLTGLLRGHATAGNIVLVSTHLLDVAATLCEAALLVDHGTTVVSGDVREVVAAARNVGATTGRPLLPKPHAEHDPMRPGRPRRWQMRLGGGT